MVLKRKKRGFGIEMRTFDGKDGQTYLAFRLPDGAFHIFLEVEAKEAARQCGCTIEESTRQMWTEIWRKAQ